MENQDNLNNQNNKGVTIDDLAIMVQKGFLGVDQRFNGMDLRLDKVDQRLDGIDCRLDKVDQRLDRVDYRLETIEKLLIKNHRMRIEKIEEDLRELKGLLALS